jgi:hypothetical protein
MCVILLLALVATAYLAVFFNRRAKADLQAALEPLAAAIEGTVNLDEAEVAGRWRGYPVYARMANASEGPGRVFQVDLVDAAGGLAWQYTSNPAGKGNDTRSVEFSGPAGSRQAVESRIDAGAPSFVDPEVERFRVEYLVEQGFVRLVRAMRTRRDIPSLDTLVAELGMLADVAEANRAHAEASAESESGR